MTLVRPGPNTVTIPAIIGLPQATMIYTQAYVAGRQVVSPENARREARDALLHFLALAVEPVEMTEEDGSPVTSIEKKGENP